MRLMMVSHKPCWHCPPHQVCTDGGFPKQVGALAKLVDHLTLVVPESRHTRPVQLQPIEGPNLSAEFLSEPVGTGTFRKFGIPFWFIRNFLRLRKSLLEVEAVHAAVPGDVGLIGLLIGWVSRKPLFIRHCGTWGDRSTLANRFLAWLLPRVAGGRVVVMATGGGPEPPEPGNLDIKWIFATSSTRAEFGSITPAAPWASDQPLCLVTVGRLSHGKNAISCIEALPAIRDAVPGSTLKVVGEGPVREELKRAVSDLGLDEAVELTGNLSHEGVLEALCGSHMFLFPTRVAEGFPKAVLEAMACGLPVVASSVSVLPHLLDEGRGVLLGGTDPSDIAGAVVDLARDPGRMATTGRLAREKAGEFTLERWRDLIGARLEAAWGRPLKEEGGYPDDPTGATT